jgi:uncharacterized membrane protein
VNGSLLSLLAPLHPPLTHFPIVCSILAVLCLAAAWKTSKAWFREAAAWLWVLTFLSGLASGLTGYLFSSHLGFTEGFSPIPPGEVLGGLLRDHVLWAMGGLSTSLICLGAAWGTLRGKPWPFPTQLGFGLVAAVLFGLAGSHGGEMVYGGPKGRPATSPPGEEQSLGRPIPGELGGGGQKVGSVPMESSQDLLEAAKDYRTGLVKLNARSWVSRTHGKRWVNTYVSKEAVEAYEAGEALPEGSLVVKESFQDQGGKPSRTEGPLYVMRKGKVSRSPATGGWEYALGWEKPVPGNPEGLTSPTRALPGDPGLASCIKCHNRFKSTDYQGGIPEDGEKP